MAFNYNLESELINLQTELETKTYQHGKYKNFEIVEPKLRLISAAPYRDLKRFIKFSRSNRYILQCDIRKYFASIDRNILKAIIRRKIKCPQTLWLTSNSKFKK